MPEEKLTAKDIAKEYKISIDRVYKIFKDPELPVQTYTKPIFVLRSEWLKYLSARHDYLNNK